MENWLGSIWNLIIWFMVVMLIVFIAVFSIRYSQVDQFERSANNIIETSYKDPGDSSGNSNIYNKLQKLQDNYTYNSNGSSGDIFQIAPKYNDSDSNTSTGKMNPDSFGCMKQNTMQSWSGRNVSYGTPIEYKISIHIPLFFNSLPTNMSKEVHTISQATYDGSRNSGQ